MSRSQSHKNYLSRKTCLLIREALKEDLGARDITTDSVLNHRKQIVTAHILAKQASVVCGGSVVREVFRVVDSRVCVLQKVREGARIQKGRVLFVIKGSAQSVLKGERVALNFLGHLSGVAALTRTFVGKVRGTRAKVFDTRKTTPLWRDLEKYAVRIGGGQNHRLGLWDQVLVKDNHWKLALPSNGLARRLHRAKKRNFVELEVNNLRELNRALKLRPNAILLDNFSVAAIKKAVQQVKRQRPRPMLEASGGITLSTIRKIAQTGVERISVGALTHSAPASDVSLEILT